MQGLQDNYLTAFARAIADAVDSGFRLAADQDEILDLAAIGYPGE